MSAITWPSLQDAHTVVFDFDGVFTDNKVYLTQDGIESVRCDRADGLAIGLLHQAKAQGLLKAEFFILSTEKNPIVSARAQKLKLDCKQGVGDKLAFLKEYFASKRMGEDAAFKGLVYLGNDLNDLAVMERAGFSVAPQDAHPLVKQRASVVLEEKGGEKFVRSFVEKWLGIAEMPLGRVYELVSHR